MINYNFPIVPNNVNVPIQLEEKIIDKAIKRIDEMDLREFQNTLKSLQEHFFLGNKDNAPYARMILFDLLTKAASDLGYDNEKECCGIANTVKKNILKSIKGGSSIEDTMKIEDEKLNDKRKKLFDYINREISLVDDLVITKTIKEKENVNGFVDIDFDESAIEDKKVDSKFQKKTNNNTSQNNNVRTSGMFSFLGWK